VNWINGEPHLGGQPGSAPVPAIFGMNFQAVSVGQKLIENGTNGGYTDAAGDPTPSMLGEIEFVDAAIGQMVTALEKEHLLDSTAIIITAKHGQSPIDTHRFFPIPGHSGLNGAPPSSILASLLPLSATTGLGLAEDDISQIWLTNSSDTLTAVDLLESNATAAGIGQILYGASLDTIFNAPGVPTHPGPCCKLREGGDPRTPDIIVLPNVGVVYTGSLKKQSEHGGFAWDDTNVMLLVSNPGLEAKTIHSFVETTQVAPTILQLLGLDPSDLDAVKSEGTPVLPGLAFVE
jgi:arylsulfatase A-like enzyme